MLNLFIRGMLEENPNILIYSRMVANFGTYETLAQIIEDRETYPYIIDEDRAYLQDFIDKKKITGHACFSETASTYHYRPQTVRLDRIAAESGESIHRFDAFKQIGIATPLAWMADYPNSYSASNDYVLNERIARAYTEARIRNLAEAFRFLKEETVSEEYHAEWLKKQQ